RKRYCVSRRGMTDERLSCVSLYLCFVHFFFFFQAEDGIRDGHVTGVQTCALPISLHQNKILSLRSGGRKYVERFLRNSTTKPTRSEERRVGKECRFRWAPYN